MEVNLNKDSWHARLYLYGYGESNLPENLCPYFWKVVAAIALLPVTWMGYIPNMDMRREGLGMKSLPTIICKLAWTLFSLIAYVVLFECLNVGHSKAFWWGVTLGPLIVGFVLVGFVFLIKKVAEKIQNAIYKRRTRPSVCKVQPPKKDNLVLAFVKAKKDKYCPVINWSDGQETEKEEKPLSEASR